MPLNSEPLEDVRIELNKLRQEIAQLKHGSRTSDQELQRVLKENTQLRNQLAELRRQNSQLQTRLSQQQST